VHNLKKTISKTTDNQLIKIHTMLRSELKNDL